MDALKNQSREVQIVLGGTLLYIILSFFDWQSYSFHGLGGGSIGENEWHGLGIINVLLAIALLAWEIGRAVDFKVGTGQFSAGQISAALALLLLVFTVITFLDWSQIRAWPEYVGTILSIVIAGAAFVRAKGEGVTIPEMPKNVGSMGGSSSSSSAPSPPAPVSDPAPPPPADTIDE